MKYLWHALQVLPPNQASAEERADVAHKLADHLGDDHDLAVLHDYVLARRTLLSRAAARALVRRNQQATARAGKEFASPTPNVADSREKRTRSVAKC
jgi:hypothetical protein